MPPFKKVPIADIYLICNPATNFNPAERIFLDQMIDVKLLPFQNLLPVRPSCQSAFQDATYPGAC